MTQSRASNLVDKILALAPFTQMDLPEQKNFRSTSPHSERIGSVPNGSEGFRTIPNGSESFGIVPHGSESFRTVPHSSETLINLTNASERKENHTLTVREAARMFETAGVARTERSIVNWCQPNKLGVPRLDSYFDPNERRYYLTPESVERAIQEELQRAASKGKEAAPAEAFGSVPKHAEAERPTEVAMDSEAKARLKQLEIDIMDLKIMNRGKDYLLEQLKNERENMLQQLVLSSKRVGELETKLLQLTDGREEVAPHPVSAER